MTALQSEEIFFVRPMEIVNTHRTQSNRSGGEASGFMEQTNNPGFFFISLAESAIWAGSSADRAS
jgi:hypothetical protein